MLMEGITTRLVSLVPLRLIMAYYSHINTKALEMLCLSVQNALREIQEDLEDIYCKTHVHTYYINLLLLSY